MPPFRGFPKKYKAGHPCNQFLIQKFISLKRSADAQKLQNQSACYHKYPLPIICIQQAILLQGVGAKMANLIKTLIHQRYNSFLNDSRHNQFHSAISQQDQQFTNQTQPVTTKTQQLVQRVHITQQQISLKHHQPSQDSKSNLTTKTFKLKKQTSAYYFMSVFEGNTDIMFSKKVIKTQAQQKFGHQITHWTFVGKLQINQYIEVFKQGYRLLPKGNLALTQLSTQPQKKSLAYQNLEKLLQTRNFQVFKQQTIQKNQIKKSDIGQYSLFLVIDNREIKSQEFKQFFNDKLVDTHNIPCKYYNLALGDFTWILSTEKYGDLVLDYIIERKISSDLASSIMDGRYKQQRFRLSNCGVSNVYYIYQGKAGVNSAISEKGIDKALRSIQFKSNFKIIRTTDIRHTIRYLNFMHQHILKLIESSQYITSISTLAKFNSRNAKSNIPLNCTFGLMIKCIPMVGRETVELLVSKFKSIRDMYLCLKQLPIEERAPFLRALIRKKNRSSENVSNIIVKILFE